MSEIPGTKYFFLKRDLLDRNQEFIAIYSFVTRDQDTITSNPGANRGVRSAMTPHLAS